MQSKGRVRAGADADLTLFDPARVIDRATFEEPAQPSAGIVHVLVGGVFVVRDEANVDGVTPGLGLKKGTDLGLQKARSQRMGRPCARVTEDRGPSPS